MKFLRKLKINTLITSLLYVALGLVFILLPEAVQYYVPLVAGVLLALLGIIYIIDYFRAWDIEYTSNGLAIGILLLFGALFLFLQDDAIMAAIPVLLGFAVVISGAVKLQNAIVLNRAKNGGWVYVLILALICLALGALFIVDPFVSSQVLIIVIGAGLLFSGVSDLIILLLMKYRFKDGDQADAPRKEKPRREKKARKAKEEAPAPQAAGEAAPADPIQAAEEAVAQAEQAVAQAQAEAPASTIAEQLEADRRNLDQLAQEARQAQEAAQAAQAEPPQDAE